MAGLMPVGPDRDDVSMNLGELIEATRLFEEAIVEAYRRAGR